MGIVNEYITKLINKIRPSETQKPWLKNYEKMAVIDNFWGLDGHKWSITNGLKVIGIG